MAASSASAMEKLLGDKLVGKNNGDSATTAALLGGDDVSVVGLYFSASWCPPCRQFTPILSKALETDLEKKGLRVVFVSSDRDEASFSQYHKKMSFYALPFAERDRKSKLAAKFKVRGIPMLVLLNAKTGKVITTDGRETVMTDPTGAKFPWKMPTVLEALGDEFDKMDGEKTERVKKADHITGHTVGILFSAPTWCGPCRNFDPILHKIYEDTRKAGHKFTVVFVSSDKSKEGAMEFFKKAPWLMVPYEDAERRAMLSKIFGVQGIPSLAIIDGDTGKVINKSGRGALTSDPAGFPWRPKAVNELSGATAGGLNEAPGLILFGDTAKGKAALEPAAKAQEEESKKKGDDDDDEDGKLAFFYAAEDNEIGKRVRQMAGGSTDPLIILSVPEQGFYQSGLTGEVDEKAVAEFVAKYKKGELKKTALG